MQYRRLALALLLPLLAACTGPEGAEEGRLGPGLGASTARPVGKSFSLPDGIELVETPRGYSYTEDPRCPPFTEVEFLGGGQIVNLCLAFENVTGAPIDVVLPPGLIFISESIESQNGLVIEITEITVPANGTVDAVVSAFCVNASRHAPDETNTFEIGPITEEPELVELIALLDGFDIPTGFAGEGQAFEQLSILQSAVWEITDGDGLTDATRAEVEAMVGL